MKHSIEFLQYAAQVRTLALSLRADDAKRETMGMDPGPQLASWYAAHPLTLYVPPAAKAIEEVADQLATLIQTPPDSPA